MQFGNLSMRRATIIHLVNNVKLNFYLQFVCFVLRRMGNGKAYLNETQNIGGKIRRSDIVLNQSRDGNLWFVNNSVC